MLFSAVTLWLGLLVTAGGVLLAQPVDLAELLHPAGAAAQAVARGAAARAGRRLVRLALLRREPLRIGDWTLPVVRAPLAARASS